MTEKKFAWIEKLSKKRTDEAVKTYPEYWKTYSDSGGIYFVKTVVAVVGHTEQYAYQDHVKSSKELTKKESEKLLNKLVSEGYTKGKPSIENNDDGDDEDD